MKATIFLFTLLVSFLSVYAETPAEKLVKGTKYEYLLDDNRFVCYFNAVYKKEVAGRTEKKEVEDEKDVASEVEEKEMEKRGRDILVYLMLAGSRPLYEGVTSADLETDFENMHYPEGYDLKAKREAVFKELDEIKPKAEADLSKEDYKGYRKIDRMIRLAMRMTK